MNLRLLNPLALSLVLGAALSGQEKTQQELSTLRDQKRAQEVFQQAEWHFDLAAALAAAKQRQQPIFAYFTRSYSPCPPCTALEQGALSEPAFVEFSKRVVLFCHVTSQVEGDAHQDLLAQKGGRAFPYLVFLDADGAVAAKQAERSVAAFLATLGKLDELAALEARFAAGDQQAGAAALKLGLELGGRSMAAARERLQKLGDIPAEQRQALAALILNAEVDALMAEVRTKAQAAEVGRTFLVMERQGRVPTGRAAITFYSVILETHEAAADAAAYAATLEQFKRCIAGQRNADRVVRRYEATLEKLRQQQGEQG